MPTFHDAVIVAIEPAVDSLALRIEDVVERRDGVVTHERGWLRITGVTVIDADGTEISCAAFGLGYDDGEILRMTVAGSNVDMLVEWQNYAQRRRLTVSYRVRAGSVAWSADAPALE